MTYRTENFNLLVEPWIPVLGNDGTTSRLGILEVLNQAHSIKQIAASNPMDRIALHRFLLSVLYWCQGSPEDHLSCNPDEPFDSKYFRKIVDRRQFFDLLGDSERFYQIRPVSGSNSNSRFVSVNYLVHEVPTGSNFVHFRHSVDTVEGLCPSCCAIGLTRLPVFATSGGRGKPPGINSKPPCYVMPVSRTLAGTLRLL